MTRLLSAIACCVALAACGVDGEPEAPQPEPQPQPQRAASQPYVSGGVAITNNGVYPSIGISQGWWSVSIGGWGGRWW